MSNYTDISKFITNKLTKEQKKKDGIFFTPYNIIKTNLNILNPYINDIKTVLEPSCGSCEFITYLENLFNDINITGIEYNKEIFDIIKEIKFKNTLLYNEDFLNYEFKETYDLIIGNPPYYVVKKNKKNEFIEGRPNIFILFIIKSLELLNDNGILSFILPKNFMNCMYYNKIRKHIYNNYTILDIIDCNNDKFLETSQETIIFIIQNKKDINKQNNDYILTINKYIIYNTKLNIIKLKDLYINSKNLNDLNFKVSVGSIVWNQCKDLLTNDNNKTRLIYSSDINNDNSLIMNDYKNINKKNFIDKEGINDILLVINRGYGVGKYNFKHCLINVNYKYLIENHLIYIKYISSKETSKDDLIILYNKIINSLNNKKTKEFIDIYFGNNAINTTELNYILPIYDI